MDSSVFEAAYAVHGASVLRYATYSVGSRQVAEDIAAEAWSRYLEKGDRVPADRVEAWLIRVTRNLCVSHHRAIARGRKLEDRVAETLGSPADGWEDPDVWGYVSRLSERERLAIYLRIVEERSFPDV
ncbi:MAG: sigma-70 family RNA polymerase sigma factor, partial [Actinomycetota bacterium]|nr:sigma-70 family RNA polymerase sigma factor [Actinomycetota bacterium]